ncbi:fungal specific transcription factor [Colletotrichum scovillei]|uniref:Fungal specific transcription factor n=1 Tax=Colletotrichum scovillei TaxID=1209932 RepID=A0A9P7QQY9_9PEZI|nr:fungal specific transcription factor [Colletotrichum scovillei]KAG7040619.1 fungal specific transcription factor [Colletotrichum scovillei]KAG7060666.1 fungal specific transcription factor [Colletotrichum scovillei]
MPDQSAQLNPLSVRCSRGMPTCERCKTHETECVYPQRVKRKVTRTLTDRLSLGDSSTTDDALSTILERLQRVEKHCTTVPNGNQDLESRDGPPASVAADPPAAAPPHRQRTSSSNSAPSNLSSPAPSSVAGGQATSPWTSFATPSAISELDVAAILKDAVDQVQRLRLQTVSAAVVTQDVRVPPELAKQWIKNYFTHMHTDMFLSLVNPRLIEMIPDLLGLPHVHLDPAILVVYYGVLYHGCALGSTVQANEEGQKYIRMLYVCCLRTLPLWQREATGSTTDLIAALTMCRTAAECFDEELAWKMYTYACEYAQALNLHNLDAYTTTIGQDESKLDADRKGFWELIQIDFFFRLLFNRPPAITDSMNTWKVNLPWLSSGSAPPDLNAVPTVTFLMGSRLTFILSHFFQDLESPDCDEATIRPKAEEYCREIGQLFDEYQIEDWIQRSVASAAKADCWLLGDVAMTGYTYIIFILRKLAVLSSNSPRPVSCDADIPDSPLAVEASRGMLRIVRAILVHNPYPETMCVLLGIYRAYVSYACLLNHILRAVDVRSHYDDIELLEEIGEVMLKGSRDDRDFMPLLRAIQSLGMEVKRRLNDVAATASVATVLTPAMSIGIGAGF